MMTAVRLVRDLGASWHIHRVEVVHAVHALELAAALATKHEPAWDPLLIDAIFKPDIPLDRLHTWWGPSALIDVRPVEAVHAVRHYLLLEGSVVIIDEPCEQSIHIVVARGVVRNLAPYGVPRVVR